MSEGSKYKVTDNLIYAGFRNRDGEKVVFVDKKPEDIESHPTYQHGIINGIKGSASAKEIEPKGELNYDAQDKHEWGYIGGGPTTTAASILNHLLGEENAREEMIDFAKNFLAGAEEEWHIESSEIPQYMEE